MIKYLIFTLILFYSSSGMAQIPLEDSAALNTAKKYYENDQYSKVISFCNRLPKSIENYRLVANSYAKLEDYHQAIKYYEKAIYIGVNNNRYKTLLRLYFSIAKTHKKLRTKSNYLASVNYIEKAKLLRSKTEVSGEDLQTIYNNLGNYYKLLLNKSKALKNHQIALQIAEKIKNNEKIHISLLNIGSIYINGINTTQDNLEKAAKYTKKSLLYGTRLNFNAYRNLGIISYLQNKPRVALAYHNNALNTILKFKYQNINNLPSTESIKISSGKSKIASVLYEKYYAWIKLFNQDNKQEYLNEALKTVEYADFSLDALFLELENEKSKLYWRKKAANFYILGVHISELLNNSEKAFYFTEKNKALLLLNNTITSEIVKKLPESILTKQTKLKKEIVALQTKKLNSDSIQNIIFDKKRAFDIFTDSLKTAFPEYANIYKKREIVTLAKTQQEINNHTAYISYIWDKTENQYDALYGVIVTKEHRDVFKITDLERFNTLVTNFRNAVSKPFSTKQDIVSFQEISFSLYTKLFPKEIQGKIQGKKLIIIPDSDLQNIPFDALITKENTLDYLIQKNEISYAYSISFLKENNQVVRNPKKEFIGFAPLSFKYDSLSPLKNSATEIQNIESFFSGEKSIDEKATKEHFLSNSNTFNIIHLATHANASNKTDPWIAFKNEKLSLLELYTCKTQADLVVLSACNTSIGEIANGEGTLSLARGFFYGGTNSVVSSLWNVDDKATENLMVEFYTNLKNKQTKSKALHRAKLNHLQNNKNNLVAASPFYWSSFILIGDDGPITFHTTNNWIIGLCILSLFVFIFYLFFRKKEFINFWGNKT